MHFAASVRGVLCSLFAYAETALCSVYVAAFREPLRRLYFHGPAWHGAGFWQGMSDADMCAQLSTVDAAFWGQHATDCTLLLERRFDSFAIAVHALMLLFIMYRVVQIIWWRLCMAPLYQTTVRACFTDVVHALERRGVFVQGDLCAPSLTSASPHLDQGQRKHQ